jgi:hypothetical protein
MRAEPCATFLADSSMGFIDLVTPLADYCAGH